MSFSWIDFMVGFLLLESMLHLSFAHSGKYYPSLFGKSPKANLVFSIVLTVVSVELYIMINDISALMNNGVLLGAVDMYLFYLVFGRWLHKQVQNNNNKINSSTVTTRQE